MKIKVENGTFSYKEYKVLDDINFQVSSGEILSVLGPNGIGKTTLLKCMMGLLNWSSGKTVLNDKNIKELTSKEIWKKIAYVPQAKAGILGLSVLDMVILGRSAHLKMTEQPGKKDYEIAEISIKEIGLEHLKNKQCNKISGGELQMVLIARALATQPDMLVLDEPESNLDFKNQLIILDTLKRLVHKKNLCSIINTHYPAHALKISDKSLILSVDDMGNKICKYGNTKEIISEKNMEEAFQVKVCIKDFEFKGKRINTVIPVERIN